MRLFQVIKPTHFLLGIMTFSLGLEPSTSYAATKSGVDLLVVDCLLPGKMRKLGNTLTFMTARRPIKTSAKDCELRGGEYTAFDRANYTTALGIWLPLAEQGDPEAQNFVGEIYEKGLGTPPNFQSAAQWYERAAKQGLARAQTNLAYLYEKGLGVSADPVRALNLYRQSAGLKEAIVLETDMAAAVQEREKQIQSLNNELSNSRDNLDSLRARNKQLNSDQQRLIRERDEALRRQDGSKIQELETLLEEKEAQSRLLNDKMVRYEGQVYSVNKELAELQNQLTDQREEFRKSSEITTAALSSEVAKRTEQTQRITELNQTVERSQEELRKAKLALQQAQANAEQSGKQAKLYEQEAKRIAREAAIVEEGYENSNNQALNKALQKAKSSKEEVDRAEEARQAAEQEIERKTQELTGLKEQLASTKPLAPAPTQTVSIAPPKIQLIDPPLMTMRSPAIVELAAHIKTRQIVGRVESVAGLFALSINDIPLEPDKNGLFKTKLDLESIGRIVSILAVDKKGNRSSLEFKFESQKQPEPSKPSINHKDFGPYHALVIGNESYTTLPDLDTAIDDAEVVSSILSDKFGFKVKTLKNANRYEILTQLNKLRSKLTENDNLLVYYAGHGELDHANLRAHWLPVDAEAESDANWISTVAITDILNAMSAKHVMLVVDSCYSGAMTRSSIGRLEAGKSEEARLSWLKALSTARSRTVMTSGGLQPVIDGGGGNHSLFAKHFIDALNAIKEPTEGQRLFQAVSAKVLYDALNFRVDQKPEYAPLRFAGHESGDFLLLPR